MKCLVVLVIALVPLVAAEEDWKPILGTERILKIRHGCKKSLGLTEEQFEKIQKIQHPDEKIFHDYVLCNYKGFGVFIDGKGLDGDRVLLQASSMFEDAVITRDMFEHCLHMKEFENNPEFAYHAHWCILKTPIGDLIREGRKKGQL